jgi:hypothetical protein
MKQSKISFVDRRIAHYSAKNCLRFQNEAWVCKVTDQQLSAPLSSRNASPK